jgi:drug/metabolite transporter (DMT)-like permease
MFTANIFSLMLAIQLLPLSIAILTYFIYPLLTGVVGAITGIDRIGWRGIVTAVVAFVGLSLMLEARVGEVDPLGIVAALFAAMLRVISLLITRTQLARTDSRLNTWYSLVPSTAIFVVFSALTHTFNFPQSSAGWLVLLGMSITSTLAILTIFISTARIGAFRTALLMNLEPLVSTLASMALLGEALSSVQAFGGAIMLVALCAFQFQRVTYVAARNG